MPTGDAPTTPEWSIIAYKGATYIRDVTVTASSQSKLKASSADLFG